MQIPPISGISLPLILPCLLTSFFTGTFLVHFPQLCWKAFLSVWVLDVSILRGKSTVDDVRWLVKTKPQSSLKIR